jgi:hypothetical protein
VENNSDGWTQLDAFRVVKKHHLGFMLVKPIVGPEPIPLFCAICGFPNLSFDDIMSHHEYGCCSKCELRWVDVDREGWVNGRRPSDDDVKLELARRCMRGFRTII